MKESQVKHILNPFEKEIKEKELTFTHYVGKIGGELYKAQEINDQPHMFRNVFQITGNLYYVYNEDELEAGVYVGEFK